MGTDPTTPGDEPQPTPDTDAPPDAGTGTEPAPVVTDEPAPEGDTSDEEFEETQVVEDDDALGDGEPDEEPVEDDREGLGEPLGRATTLADDTAPGGHVQADADGNPRQAGDSNPELGVAPDKLPEGVTPSPPPERFEPEALDIDRPDVGTPVTDTQPEGSVTEPPAEEE